ncbi:DNA-binding protein [Salmonella enterica]|nr:DNA-binding protein [Salmonella enterica subsp. enterica serovar Oranienburg]EAR0361207.1 DNA-binding protein [Salmonella enterica subsp. enterica serovar Oranienburg]EAU5124545.1 DNA-binding protein [Salmonella enterica subsp. enterica serovar Infantis]EBF0135151.1 DNA-binding protein [Salmonella enterica]
MSQNTTPLLALNGQIIPLKRLSVSVKLNIKDKDASGKSSSTATSEQGVKAKELQVSGLIPFETPEALTLLFRLAEAKTASGAQQVYRIGNMDAKAVNMQQGIFSGAVGATPETGLMAWKVDFTLKEKLSSAEKAIGRGPAGSQDVDQHAQAAKAGSDSKDGKQEEHGWFWNVSDKLNKWIGPAGNETDS